MQTLQAGKDQEVELTGFSLRQWQADVVGHLSNKRDVLLVAPTGAGKGRMLEGMAGAEALRDKLVVVFGPLKVLGRELKERLEKVLGDGAMTINEDAKDRALFDRLRGGHVKMLFISPEMGLSPRFLELFDDQKFRSRLGAVVLDEAHTLTEWSTRSGFREKFKELSIWRNQTDAVGLAMSGTLPKEYRLDVKRHFQLRDLVELDFGVDRPNLCVQVSVMRHSPGSCLDLVSVMPELWPTADGAAELVPTIVYHNDKAELQHMLKIMRKHFDAAGLTGKITTFSADSSESHKGAIKRLVEEGELACILATDALGMGSDMAEIERVVQWGIDKHTTPAAVMQRLGRAGRRPLRPAKGVILVEPWVVGTGTRNVKQQQAADADLIQLVQDAVEKKCCTRKTILALLDHPEKPPYTSEELFGVEKGAFDRMPCCGVCAGLEVAEVPASFLTASAPKPNALPRKAVIAERLLARLNAWRAEMAAGAWAARIGDEPLGEEAFLRDADIEELVSQVDMVVHGLREDSPAVFKLNRFILSLHGAEVEPEVRLLVQQVVQQVEDEARAAAADAAQAQAEKRAADDDADQKAEEQRWLREAQQRLAQGLTVRQCEECRKWNAKPQNASNQVVPYGHNKRNGRCPSRRKQDAANAAADASSAAPAPSSAPGPSSAAASSSTQASASATASA